MTAGRAVEREHRSDEDPVSLESSLPSSRSTTTTGLTLEAGGHIAKRTQDGRDEEEMDSGDGADGRWHLAS